MSYWLDNGKQYARVKNAVKATYGETCHLCGGQIETGQWSIDHVVPRSKGGTNDLWNLRPAHKRCNYRKGNRTPTTPPPRSSRKW